MKPKTKLQIQVTELSKKLPKISNKMANWGYKNCFDDLCVILRKSVFCLQCGSVSSIKDYVLNDKSLTCSKCNCKMIISNNYKAGQINTNYFSVFDFKDDFQIVRIICVKKYMKKNEKPIYYHKEVMQHWIRIDGKITSLALAVSSSMYYDNWIFYSELSIKERSFYNSNRFNISPSEIFPTINIHPILLRNGFDYKFYGILPQTLFIHLFSNNNAEILLKAKQIHLLKRLILKNYFSDELWRAVKICIKNNYIVENANDWIDYVNLLIFFDKDINNSFYVCPLNLEKEHNKMVNKKRKFEHLKNLDLIKDEIAENQKLYFQQKSKYFGFIIEENDLKISVIDKVQDFLFLGDIFKHCIFANEYYKKENSLILKATFKNVPVETIEFSLSDFSIIQARGNNNLPSIYNNQIIEIINKYSSEIKKIHLQKQRRKTA